MSVWDRFLNMDRRWIYLMVAMSVIIPILIPVRFPVSITPEARQLYDAVEELPDSSVVMLTFDFYPSTKAETEPIARAALHHLFRKDCRIITLTTVPLGTPSLTERVTREMAELYGKEYGIDYVNLGYKANYVAVLQGMGASIENIYPADNRGTPLSELPLMGPIKNYDDIAFIFVVSDNTIVDYWLSIVQAQYHIRVGAGVTSVSAPRYYAFLGSGQMTGLLGGMKGAAEYEQLVGHLDKAMSGMDIQSIVHLLIIGLVVLGNISFFMTRRRRAGGSA